MFYHYSSLKKKKKDMTDYYLFTLFFMFWVFFPFSGHVWKPKYILGVIYAEIQTILAALYN